VEALQTSAFDGSVCHLILTCETNSEIMTKIHSLILRFNDVFLNGEMTSGEGNVGVNFKVPAAFS
jgi:hypothetical protein